MAWFVLLVLVAIAGVFAYRWLIELEREIRAEIGMEELPVASEKATTGETLLTGDVSEEILACVKANPGVLQTHIYSDLSRFDRKVLQKELLDLDRSGRISRVRSGNTYQLYLQ